jgi:hypothetical protein
LVVITDVRKKRIRTIRIIRLPATYQVCDLDLMFFPFHET